MADGLTPTERRMLQLLSDGLPHRRKELKDCLYDEMGSMSNIRFHLCMLRKKLPPGEYIACELYRGAICYRHGRLIVSAV